MIGLVALGLYMSETEAYGLYLIHKSIGTILIAVILIRAIIRLRKGWPANVSKGKAWEHALARVVHWVLIVTTLVVPVSGMIDSVMIGRGLGIFGLELIADNMDANGEPIAINKSVGEFAGWLHGAFGWILIGALVLHIAGALKHHLIDRDGTLRRMLGATST